MAEIAVAPESSATQEAERWLGAFETALADRDAAAAAALFATDSYWRDLVAFTWNLKTVEGRGGRRRPGRAHGRADGRPRLPRHRAGRGGRRRHRGLDRVRDRGWPRQRASAPQGGQGLDAAHHARRAQGPRGAPRAGPAARCRARRRARSRELARAAPARGRGARGHHTALRRHHRRRAGRHRAGRAAAPARRPDRHRRPSPAARRPVAQPLQVALPPRPGLVRPPALHQVPRELARVLAEGQDRRLARDVHAGDGAQLLGLDGGQERELGSRGAGVDRAGRARGPRGDVAPQAARLRHGHVEPAQPAPARGHGRLPGRAAPLVPAPRTRRLSRQAGGRDRLQQLRARHLRRALGDRRRRDHGPALVHPHRALGHAHGHRPGRPVLRAGGGRRGHHREGRHDLRVAALPDPARVPDPALRPDARARRRLLRVAWRPSGSSSTGARTARACS